MWTLWYGNYRYECVSCNKDLDHNHIIKENGTKVRVTEYPNGYGKIKSLMSCSHDMCYVEGKNE